MRLFNENAGVKKLAIGTGYPLGNTDDNSINRVQQKRFLTRRFNQLLLLNLKNYLDKLRGNKDSSALPLIIMLYEEIKSFCDSKSTLDDTHLDQCEKCDVNKYSDLIRYLIVYFDSAIILGDADAMTQRAWLHQHGIGGKVDLNAAIQLYDKAIALDNDDAMVHRALIHQEGESGVRDYEIATELYERAKKKGNSQAMYYLASLIQPRADGSVDWTNSIKLYDQAITLNNQDAMQNRAAMHRRGLGGIVNYPAAIALYEKAIALGNSASMFDRAEMHIFAQGGPINYPAAIKLLDKAISFGFVPALCLLAKLDQTQAIKLYDQAMAFGDYQAVHERAVMHQNAREYSDAIKLYSRAIQFGQVAESMCELAWMYKMGWGCNVDYAAAIALFEKAIVLNDTFSMYGRGEMHEQGQGCIIDYQEAIKLYDQAITLGSAHAMMSRAVMHYVGRGGQVNFSEFKRLIHEIEKKIASGDNKAQRLVQIVKNYKSQQQACEQDPDVFLLIHVRSKLERDLYALIPNRENYQGIFKSIHTYSYAQALRRTATCKDFDLAVKISKLILEIKRVEKLNINEQAGDSKRAAIHYAADVGNVELYDLLVAHGANSDLPDADQQTARQLLQQQKPSI